MIEFLIGVLLTASLCLTQNGCVHRDANPDADRGGDHWRGEKRIGNDILGQWKAVGSDLKIQVDPHNRLVVWERASWKPRMSIWVPVDGGLSYFFDFGDSDNLTGFIDSQGRLTIPIKSILEKKQPGESISLRGWGIVVKDDDREQPESSGQLANQIVGTWAASGKAYTFEPNGTILLHTLPAGAPSTQEAGHWQQTRDKVYALTLHGQSTRGYLDEEGDLIIPYNWVFRRSWENET
jgi:hypothetical protein